MKSKRVRTALALDAIEDVVKRCGDYVREFLAERPSVQNELRYGIKGAVDEAAKEYGVDSCELIRESTVMLRDEMRHVLESDHRCEIKYVRPLMDGDCKFDGTVVAKFYIWNWR